MVKSIAESRWWCIQSGKRTSSGSSGPALLKGESASGTARTWISTDERYSRDFERSLQGRHLVPAQDSADAGTLFLWRRHRRTMTVCRAESDRLCARDGDQRSHATQLGARPQEARRVSACAAQDRCPASKNCPRESYVGGIGRTRPPRPTDQPHSSPAWGSSSTCTSDRWLLGTRFSIGTPSFRVIYLQRLNERPEGLDLARRPAIDPMW